MKKAQLQAQEQERIAWENAIPLGGKSCDVYCFDMALSVGDISDNGIGEQRKNVFKKMLSVCFVEDLDYQVEEKIQKIKTTLTSVIERYVACLLYTSAMKSMREDLKAVERLRKTAEQLSRQERDKSHDREPER